MSMEKLKQAWKYKCDIPVYWKWKILFRIQHKQKGLAEEMVFWDLTLKKIALQPTETANVAPALKQLRKTFKERLIVLEIGPGPVSRLTRGWEANLYDLIAIDPLADEYMKLRKNPFLVKGYAEEMDKMFQPESFHMVYASNSLDHTSNPALCFRNMVSLTKVGGLIIVCGNEREGSRAKWLGLHQHNLWLDDDNLICQTKGVPLVCLSKGLPIKAVTKRRDFWRLEDGTEHPWISITYEKVGNLSYSQGKQESI